MGSLEDAESQDPPLRTHRKSSSSHSDASSDSDLSSLESALLADDNVYSSGKIRELEKEEGRYCDLEDGDPHLEEPLLASRRTKTSTGSRSSRVMWTLGLLCLGGWGLAFILFLAQQRSSVAAPSDAIHDLDSVTGSSRGKPVTLDQVLSGEWLAQSHSISWIPGSNGEDGLLVEVGGADKGKGYLRVNDIRDRKEEDGYSNSRVLMNDSYVKVDGETIFPNNVWPSRDMKSVLLLSDQKKNWRHSYVGCYWLLDVETQAAQPLDPAYPDGQIQLAVWSPRSDAVVFVRDNNIYLRKLSTKEIVTITEDGGKDLFYGVPDWVYEEEVFAGNSVTWWSSDGKYIAFLRTNESAVPEYPVQYFLSRPSGEKPPPGLENYPEVRQIKYPKAGAPNPVVNLEFYDVEKSQTFAVELPENFSDDDRVIIEVVWASAGSVLVRETNRESDVLKVFLINTESRTGKLVREENITDLDGGWVEPTQSTQFIPADITNGRPDDGYIDTIVLEGYDHLGYFTPLDNPNPVILTSGEWEVTESAVDIQRGIVFFIGTKESPIERHLYRVKLDGSDLRPLTNTSKPGYYDASFSSGAGYALLSYRGPEIPWQAVVNTQSDIIKYEQFVEENKELSQMVKEYALPIEVYQNVTIDGYTLQVVERLPPQFNPAKKYPVLFYLYGGPGSQTVERKFSVDFQSYIASSLGYIVVTVDGRGTGFIGRKARCIVRGNLGHYESRDQIETARIWAKKEYVDETRMAIWGWSYGGFMTLKTLEQDAGQTFRYGMAVAPVTDWSLYDSLYTERYMHTPQHNPSGYAAASISNVSALAETTRFLIFHGVSDDNVHMQNSLVLIDKLDLSNVLNYDVQVFPDSDHGIFFHNGHKVVYERLSTWLINAFNGEWERIVDPVPEETMFQRFKRSIASLLG